MAAVVQSVEPSPYWFEQDPPTWYDKDVPPPSLDDLQCQAPHRPIDPENYRYQKSRPFDWQSLTAERRAETDAYLRVKERDRQIEERTRKMNEEYWEEFRQREAMDRCPSPDYRDMPGYCEEYQEERAQRMEERQAEMKKHHCPSPESTPPGSPAMSRPIPNKRKRPAEPELSIPKQMARLLAWHEAQQEPSPKRQKQSEEPQPAKETRIAEEAQPAEVPQPSEEPELLPADEMQLVEESRSGEEEPPAEGPQLPEEPETQSAEKMQLVEDTRRGEQHSPAEKSETQLADGMQLVEAIQSGGQEPPAGTLRPAEEPRPAEEALHPQHTKDPPLNEMTTQQKRKRTAESLDAPAEEEASGSSPKKRKIAEPVSRKKTTREILNAVKEEVPRRPFTRSRPGTTASLDLSKKNQVLMETQPGCSEILSMEDYMKRLQDGHTHTSTPPHIPFSPLP